MSGGVAGSGGGRDLFLVAMNKAAESNLAKQEARSDEMQDDIRSSLAQTGNPFAGKIRKRKKSLKI